MTKNTLWIDDPMNVLFDINKLFLIIPDRSDTVNEQVNSFTRFILLYGVILSVYKKSWDPLVWSGAMALLVLGMLVWFVKKRVDVVSTTIIGSKQPVSTNNPFGNPVMGSDDTPQDQVFPESDALFVENLPLDEWDIYGKNNSQRQFFTLPPNDQTSFAEWLYKPNDICKTNPSQCTGY